jgi:hypothetical protein
MADIEGFLDRLHARARALPLFQRLAVISRILLAVAFVPTALVKVTGHRFTQISVDDPIGYFFEALYRSGGYWRFIGAAQLLTGLMLLVPRTATLGAVCFFPIVLNIFIITVSLHFPGTTVITGLMTLAGFFLLCWDYDRLKAVLWSPGRNDADRWGGPGPGIERAGYALGTAAALGALLGTRGFAASTVRLVCLPLGVVAVLMVLAGWIRASRTRV